MIEEESSISDITIVDDDRICHFIISHLINICKPGCRISLFKNPVTFLETILNKSYYTSVIFLDINMPEMSGWEVLEKMQEQTCLVPVYMLTSSSNEGDKLKAAKFNHIMGYFVKPLTVEQLKIVMERHFPQ
jgi:DNA-binding NtrC family response regulator